MDNSEWLTIRDFAEKTHVSRQAVYQRIKGLEQYTRQSVNENGKTITLVNTAALALFDKGNSSQVVSQFQAGNDKLVDVLTAEIERLRADNERLTAEKSALFDSVKEKDQQLFAERSVRPKGARAALAPLGKHASGMFSGDRGAKRRIPSVQQPSEAGAEQLRNFSISGTAFLES